MDEKIKLIADSFGRDKVKLDENLSQYTALKVGGKVKLFFVAFTTQEIIRMVQLANQLKVPVFIFGSGSKMIISDDGFEGVVIKNRTQNISVVGVKGKVTKLGIGVAEALLDIDAGVSIKKCSEFLTKQGLESGEIESIPGTIGGNLFINPSLRRKVQKIMVISEGEIEEIKVDELSLRKHIVLSAIFKFKAKERT